MGIREKGYHTWDGELKTGGLVWLPIFQAGIKTAFKKKFAKAFFSFALGPFLFFLAGLFFASKPELKMFTQAVTLLKSDAYFFNAFFTNPFTYMALMLMCIFVFSELISGDLKYNSFPLYFSRPLERKDYVLGKFSIIMFYLLLFTLLPGILLLIFKFIFTGEIVIAFRTLFAIIVVPILISTLFAAITLTISSLSSNSRYVKIIIFLLFAFSNGISEMLKGLFKNTYFNLISFPRNIEQMSTYIFSTKPAFSAPGWMSLAVVTGVIILAFLIIFKRIGKSEAQIEIGS